MCFQTLVMNEYTDLIYSLQCPTKLPALQCAQLLANSQCIFATMSCVACPFTEHCSATRAKIELQIASSHGARCWDAKALHEHFCQVTWFGLRFQHRDLGLTAIDTLTPHTVPHGPDSSVHYDPRPGPYSTTVSCHAPKGEEVQNHKW